VSRKDEYRHTVVKRGATIGANATVVCGVTLGRYCFVGAGSVVTRDVPDFAMVYGNPARLRGWMCRCGVKLALGVAETRGETAECVGCGRRYRNMAGTIAEAGQEAS
jgi:UDP-2-acetamido-3-amino-2,3-dideoxy-glucuronate N-acetyltransferase